MVMADIQQSEMTEDQRVTLTHDEIESVTDNWRHLCRSAALPNLRRLQVNIANCYCALGCHRLIESVGLAFALAGSHDRLEVIEILGAKSQRERDFIMQQILHSMFYYGSNIGDTILRFKRK